MEPEVIDCWCIPVLVRSNTLRRVSQEQADKISLTVKNIFPGWDRLKVVVIPTLYLLTDFLDRELDSELAVSAVALALFLEERLGKTSNFLAFNPYEIEGVLPEPRFDDRAPALRWAVLPVIIYGDEEGYDRFFDYLAGIEDELEGSLDALSEVIKEVYGFDFAQAFPPTMYEDLLDELEEIERALGFRETTAS